MGAGYDPAGWHVVVGMGSAGSRHLQILQDLGIRNRAVVRSHHGPTRRVTPPGVREFSDLQDALDLDPVAAVIATPTSMHVAQAQQVLERRVPVLVEKPLAETFVGATQLVRAARQEETILQVGYHLRHHPAMRWLRSVLADGALGGPMMLRASWGEYLPGWHPGEDYRVGYAARADLGGGPLLTLSHVVDYAIWLLGKPSEAVQRSWNVSPLELTVPDTSVVTLTHGSGAISLLEMDYWTRPASHVLELRCAMGTVLWDVGRGHLSVREAEEHGGLLPPLPGPTSRQECFVLQMQDFLQEVSLGTTPDYEHDLVVSAILDGGQRASHPDTE